VPATKADGQEGKGGRGQPTRPEKGRGKQDGDVDDHSEKHDSIPAAARLVLKDGLAVFVRFLPAIDIDPRPRGRLGLGIAASARRRRGHEDPRPRNARP